MGQRNFKYEAMKLLRQLPADIITHLDTPELRHLLEERGVLCKAMEQNRPELLEQLLQHGVDPDGSEAHPTCRTLQFTRDATKRSEFARILLNYGSKYALVGCLGSEHFPQLAATATATQRLSTLQHLIEHRPSIASGIFRQPAVPAANYALLLRSGGEKLRPVDHLWFALVLPTTLLKELITDSVIADATLPEAVRIAPPISDPSFANATYFDLPANISVSGVIALLRTQVELWGAEGEYGWLAETLALFDTPRIPPAEPHMLPPKFEALLNAVETVVSPRVNDKHSLALILHSQRQDRAKLDGEAYQFGYFRALWSCTRNAWPKGKHFADPWLRQLTKQDPMSGRTSVNDTYEVDDFEMELDFPEDVATLYGQAFEIAKLGARALLLRKEDDGAESLWQIDDEQRVTLVHPCFSEWVVRELTKQP